MRLRILLLAVALLGAGCKIDTGGVFKCLTPGDPEAVCPTGQTCGNDLLCHATDIACSGKLQRCGSDCVDFTNTTTCGKCTTKCAPGDNCVLPSGATDVTLASCQKFCGADAPTSCPAGTGFACKDTAHDRANCGNCGNACNTGFNCVADSLGHGQCVASCPTGQDFCNGLCADRSTDALNCGTCGNKCGNSQKCVSGTCTTVCQNGLTLCPNGKCTDTNVDQSNCGACGQTCSAGHVCKNAACLPAPTCPQGSVACNGTCVDTSTDNSNCGGCTTGTTHGVDDFACSAGFSCQPHGSNGAGVCELSCFGTQLACPTAAPTGCIDPAVDPSNCGACGNACSAGQTCSSGHCVSVLSCGAGQIVCNGTCVDTTSDRANCGGCTTGTTPNVDNFVCGAGKVCANVSGHGSCVSNCPTGEKVCSGACVNVQVDRNNCGDCAQPCPAGQVCNGSGACTTSCPSGSTNCTVGGQSTCVDTVHDNANCGGCGAPCPAGKSCQATVVSGVTVGSCQPDCGAGYSACPAGNPTSCKDTQNDAANCGVCGNSCSGGQACVGGHCQCPSGLSFCSNGSGGGACKDLQNDPNNCGVCGGVGGQACGAGQVCQGGGCQLTCASGLTPCNGSCVNTNYDPSNCNACGHSCGPYANATAYCAAGTCAPSCSGTFADCNGNTADGCETNLSNDPAHCGGCLNACKGADNASASCGGGACGLSGNVGFNNCDSDLTNGFESNKAGDAANCGSCGNNCAGSGSGSFCISGNCSPSFSGLEQNVSVAALTAAGWGTPCYTGTYADSGVDITATIRAACGQNNVLIGCRPAGGSTLTVAAAGLASDVFADTGSAGTNTPNGSNTTWYFNGASSWGFAPATASINRSACDIAGGAQDGFAAGFGTQRLCWLTSNGKLSAGGRCGDKETPGAAYERVVFTKP